MKNKYKLLLVLVLLLASSLACGGVDGAASGSSQGISASNSPGAYATSTAAAQEFHFQLTQIAIMDATPIP